MHIATSVSNSNGNWIDTGAVHIVLFTFDRWITEEKNVFKTNDIAGELRESRLVFCSVPGICIFFAATEKKRKSTVENWCNVTCEPDKRIF